MTIERDIPADLRADLEQTETAEFLLIFLRITHPTLDTPITVVSDPENFILDGEEYIGFPFEITLLNDDDSPPRAQLTVQNVDRIIGQTLLNTIDPARIDIKVIQGSEFDLTEFPRVPLATPAITYHARNLYLTEVEGTAATVRGTLRSWDYTQEVWPGLRATENRFPGIYW